VLERAEAEAKLSFVRAVGIIHQAQPQDSLEAVRRIALSLDDFGLAGLAFGASLFGSAILAIALQRGWLDGLQAFELSRLDEAWQEERWGVDAEAAERAGALVPRRGTALDHILLGCQRTPFRRARSSGKTANPSCARRPSKTALSPYCSMCWATVRLP